MAIDKTGGTAGPGPARRASTETPKPLDAQTKDLLGTLKWLDNEMTRMQAQGEKGGWGGKGAVARDVRNIEEKQLAVRKQIAEKLPGYNAALSDAEALQAASDLLKNNSGAGDGVQPSAVQGLLTQLDATKADLQQRARLGVVVPEGLSKGLASLRGELQGWQVAHEP